MISGRREQCQSPLSKTVYSGWRMLPGKGVHCYGMRLYASVACAGHVLFVVLAGACLVARQYHAVRTLCLPVPCILPCTASCASSCTALVSGSNIAGN